MPLKHILGKPRALCSALILQLPRSATTITRRPRPRTVPLTVLGCVFGLFRSRFCRSIQSAPSSGCSSLRVLQQQLHSPAFRAAFGFDSTGISTVTSRCRRTGTATRCLFNRVAQGDSATVNFVNALLQNLPYPSRSQSHRGCLVADLAGEDQPQ